MGKYQKNIEAARRISVMQYLETYRKSKIWQAVNCPPQRYARRMNATGTNYLFGKGWKDNGRKDR